MLRAPDGTRWALRHGLQFLERRDVARLIVAVLESGAVSLAVWLQMGDAYPLIIEDAECIHIAVAEGCWSAALALLESFRRGRETRKNHSIPLKARAQDATPFVRVVTMLGTLPFVFPTEVVYRAAERGDLPALEWLLKSGGFNAQEAMRRAARANRFDVVEWLVRATPGAECFLTLAESKSLRAVCWSYKEPFGNKVVRCAATMHHGYAEVMSFGGRVQTPDIGSIPLADVFAARGDLESLNEILQLPSAARFFTSQTIVKASAGGFLPVVQWLVSLAIRQCSLVEAASSAAKNGHLSVVQWLFQFPETHQSSVLSQAIEGGHLEACRWISSELPRLPSGLVQSFPVCKAAGTSKNPAMIAFVRDECEIAFSLMAVQSMGVNATRRHIQNVLDGRVLSNARVTATLFEQVAKFGTCEALVFMVNEHRMWRPDLLTQVARSAVEAVEKVKFVLDKAAVRAQDLRQPPTECLDFDVKDLFGIVLAGGFEVAMWLLENIPEADNVSAFQAAEESTPASYPDCIPHIAENLVAPAPVAFVTASQIQAFVLAFIWSRPASSRAIPWLPRLTVRLNSEAAFTRLRKIGHPEIYREDTLNAIVKYSRNPRLMMVLLTTTLDPTWEITTSRWAARFALLSVLHVLYRRATSAIRDHRVAVLHTTVTSAATTPQVEVLEWVRSAGCSTLAIDQSVAFQIDMKATSVHPRALQWIDDNKAAPG